MPLRTAPGVYVVVACVLSAGSANLGTVAPVPGAARQATPQPQRPLEPPELVEARAREKEARDRLETIVRGYLWPASEAERVQAETALRDPAYANVSRKRFLDLEEILRRGRTDYPAVAVENGTIPLQALSLPVPSGPVVPVLVQLPPGYTPAKAWPLIWAMHGGPPSNPAQVRGSAERMIRVWSEAAAAAGWIVASPGITPSLTAGPRTENRLPYEVFHPEQVDHILRALRTRYRINPDRIVSTGISLGSNYSLQFAAARPGWFSAIVPVSTEGDSREPLLRNLKDTPVYVLEGARDRNIWGIEGPRALADILTGLAYDVIYREFPDRAHEGFEDHYPDVLRALEVRPRVNYPTEVVRVPHAAIMPVERRVRWIESDTRQGVVRATITSSTRIDIETRWTRALTLYLHDRLVDLDKPLDIWVNGVREFSGVVSRSIATALEEARALDDERRISAARVHVKVTAAAANPGRTLWSALTPRHPEKTLSYWERFAIAALAERLPTLGVEGPEVAMPTGPVATEQVAIRVNRVTAGSPFAAMGLRTGDLLLEVDGEPFFRGNGAVEGLRQRLMRELRSEPVELRLLVWRDGRQQTLAGKIGLGPYAAAPPAKPAGGEQGQVLVRIETAMGAIDLAIDVERAPISATNFLKYVDGGFYDGGRFHRVTREDNYAAKLPNRPLLEVIQADINPARVGEAFPPIPLERTTVTGLKHVAGTVSMARGAADSARFGFFILLNDQPSLDYGGLRFDDGQGAAAFGRVVAGLSVARAIQQQPVKDQSLTPPVQITKAYRVR